MAYTTETKIENYLGVDIDPSFSTQITAWINAAKLFIDKYTGRKDGFEAASQIRYFDGNGKIELVIDSFVAVTTLQILELDSTDIEYTLTEGMDNDFITYPYENDSPKYKLIMVPNSQLASWPEGKKRIKVTATFGYASTVPADIELAATMLVAKVVEKGQRGGEVSSERLGDYAVTFRAMTDSDNQLGVKQILDKYRIITIG